MAEVERQKYSVILVAECETVKSWASNNKRTILETVPKFENVILFLYRTGRGTFPKDLEEIPKELGKCCEYRDFKALPFSTLDQTIAAWLEVHSDENTYIYFLNNRDRMTAVEELFNKETADFDNVLTLKMAYTTYAKKFKKDKRFKNYNIKNDKDNEDAQSNINDKEVNSNNTKDVSDYSPESTSSKQEQPSGTNSNKQSSTDDSDSTTKNNTDNISSFSFNEFFSDDEDNSKESEKSDKTLSTLKRERNNKQPVEDDFDPLDNMEFEPPPSSIVHEDVSRNEPSNNPDTRTSARLEDDKEYNQRKQEKSSGLKKPSNMKNKPKEPEDNRTLEEIEKEIFGDEKKYKKIEKVYTELDLSKMKTVDLYLERLINGIKKYCKKDADGNIDIDYNNFIEFIMILLKAENYDDFIKSWEVISSFDISLTEEEYTFIKEEAEYYAEVCNLFYGKDKW